MGVNYCRTRVEKNCNIVGKCEVYGANTGMDVNEVSGVSGRFLLN